MSCIQLTGCWQVVGRGWLQQSSIALFVADQHTTLSMCRQLQAGARVLDIRLAVNPWIAVQARQQQQHLDLASAATTSSRSLVTRAAAAACAVLHQFSQQQQPVRHHNITPLLTHPGGEKQPPLQLFQLDPVSLQGAINMSAAGGPLTVSERRGCIVGSHSLPGAPLLHMLRDIRRFLAENPGEVRGGWGFNLLVQGAWAWPAGEGGWCTHRRGMLAAVVVMSAARTPPCTGA